MALPLPAFLPLREPLFFLEPPFFLLPRLPLREPRFLELFLLPPDFLPLREGMV